MSNRQELDLIYRKSILLQISLNFDLCGSKWDKVSPTQYNIGFYIGINLWELFLTQMSSVIILDVVKNKSKQTFSIDSDEDPYVATLFNAMSVETNDDALKIQQAIKVVRNFKLTFDEFANGGAKVKGFVNKKDIVVLVFGRGGVELGGTAIVEKTFTPNLILLPNYFHYWKDTGGGDFNAGGWFGSEGGTPVLADIVDSPSVEFNDDDETCATFSAIPTFPQNNYLIAGFDPSSLTFPCWMACRVAYRARPYIPDTIAHMRISLALNVSDINIVNPSSDDVYHNFIVKSWGDIIDKSNNYVIYRSNWTYVDAGLLNGLYNGPTLNNIQLSVTFYVDGISTGLSTIPGNPYEVAVTAMDLILKV